MSKYKWGCLLLFFFGCTASPQENIPSMKSTSTPSDRPAYVLLIHGGAGTIRPEGMSPERERAYELAMEEALRAGEEILKEGGKALDAVCVACGGWKETKGQLRVGLADPLAVSMVFEPELVAVERGRVHLRLFDHHLPDGGAFEGDEVTGATSFEKRSDGPHRVVTSSRGTAARDHVLSILREG